MHFFRPISYKCLPSRERTTGPSTKEYRPLSNTDDDNPQDPAWHPRTPTRTPILSHLTIISTSLAIISSSLIAYTWIRSHSLQTCLAQTSSYCMSTFPTYLNLLTRHANQPQHSKWSNTTRPTSQTHSTNEARTAARRPWSWNKHGKISGIVRPPFFPKSGIIRLTQR